MHAAVGTAVFGLLDAIRRQARAWIVVESLAVLALALVAAIWAAYALDRLVEPPAWVRAGVVVAAVVALGWLAVVRLALRVTRPLPDKVPLTVVCPAMPIV